MAWQVKLCDPLLAHATPEHTRVESVKCMLYSCLEWYKWVLMNLYHHRQLYNTLIPSSRESPIGRPTNLHLYFTLEWIRELTLRYTTPDIHCRRSRHECDGGKIYACFAFFNDLSSCLRIFSAPTWWLPASVNPRLIIIGLVGKVDISLVLPLDSWWKNCCFLYASSPYFRSSHIVPYILCNYHICHCAKKYPPGICWGRDCGGMVIRVHMEYSGGNESGR